MTSDEENFVHSGVKKVKWERKRSGPDDIVLQFINRVQGTLTSNYQKSSLRERGINTKEFVLTELDVKLKDNLFDTVQNNYY
jgi:hypothetical protein